MNHEYTGSTNVSGFNGTLIILRVHCGSKVGIFEQAKTKWWLKTPVKEGGLTKGKPVFVLLACAPC